MIDLAQWWNLVSTWAMGFGGAGTLVALGAWGAWYFSPVGKSLLLHVAIGATVFALTSGYFYTKGYDAAIAAVAAADQGAIDRVAAGAKDIDACRARGGAWDVTTGSCSK